jgi:alkylation response protein AidB-like acyl-CoA dehydrogenase
VDERGDAAQREALGQIFSGALGGTALEHFPWAWKASDPLGVEPARIEIDHTRGRGWFRAGESVSVRVSGPYAGPETITCVIPGHERTGRELVVDELHSGAGALAFEYSGVCGYESTFDYHGVACDADLRPWRLCRRGRLNPVTQNAGLFEQTQAVRGESERADSQQQPDDEGRQRDQDEGKVECHSNSLIGRRAPWVEPLSAYNRAVSHEVLNEEQREIRDLIRALSGERIAPRAAEIDKSSEFPWDVVELFREHDLFGIMFDEEYGGAGASALMTLVAIEEVSKVCATSGLILAVQELGSLGIKLAGSEEQKQRFLPKLASGEWLPAYALTEPGSGSDSAAMRSEASREGHEYVLNGSKRFITNAGVAGLYVVFAKTDPDAGHAGISAFVVEADTPGFEVGRIEPKMGIKGSTTGELFFNDMRIPADNLLGEEGEGFRIAMRILDRSRPGIGAQGLGLAQGATDYALDYAKSRETMGKPIAQHQLIAATLADMETKCEAARGLLYKCGQLIDDGADGSELTKISAMAKLYCTDVAMEVTTDAVQILGGYGYMQEYPVERMMRDAKITQIYEGTNQIQRLVIAREMVKEQRSFSLAGVG